MRPFSIQTLTALVDVVTGGPGGSREPPIGLYRSGPELERFFGNLGLVLNVGSRVPSVRNMLDAVNQEPSDRGKISKVIEAVADPRDYLATPERLEAVVEYMNERLRLDGCQLRRIGDRHRLVPVAANAVAAAALHEAADKLDFDSVQRDFDRALAEAESNPEGAITAACSTVESVCKCLLDKMRQPYPAKRDIKGLVTEVGKHLNLSPGREDLPAEYEQDIRQILGGLSSVTGGIGALRTHAGDAHGKGMLPVTVDSRIAWLAIHSASTVSLFFVKTWERGNEQVAQTKQ